MNQILRLLTSIKTWTILGVVASAIVLFTTLYQEYYKSKVDLSSFGWTIPNQFDGDVIIVNSVSIPEARADGIVVNVPLDFDIANTTDKSISNIYLNLSYNSNQGIRIGDVKYAPLYWKATNGKTSPLYSKYSMSRDIIQPYTTITSTNTFNDSTFNLCYPAIANATIDDVYVFRGELNICGDKCKNNKYNITVLTYWSTYNPDTQIPYDKNKSESINEAIGSYGQYISQQLAKNCRITLSKAKKYLNENGYKESALIVVPMILGPFNPTVTEIEGSTWGNVTAYPTLIQPLIFNPE